MISNSILPIPIPDGTYVGTWNGIHVTINMDGDATTFKVDKVARNHNFPCVIVVKDKKAIVDSGNPCTTIINNEKQNL